MSREYNKAHWNTGRLVILGIIIFIMSLKVYPQACPTAYAGVDDTICVTDTHQLAGIITNSSNYYWSTDGGGTFSDPTDLNAIYTPGGSDLVDGTLVTITLTAQPLPSCPGPPAVDYLTLLMVAEPSADAGSDAFICEGELYTVFDATANYYSSVGWTIITGTGTLLNSNSLTPTYIPSSGDITSGMVELALFAYGNAPCSSSNSNTMQIFISEAPDVYAGADTNICETDSYTITDASVANYLTFIWSGGDGTFSDPLSISPTYTPGTGDLIAGQVDLVLHVIGTVYCGSSFTDTLNITFEPEPIADAGIDDSICVGDIYTINGAAAYNYQSVFWLSSGTGTFTDQTTLTPTYTPSVLDYLSGNVSLTLYSLANFPCSGLESDDMVLYFIQEPSVSAGSDQTTCSISPISLTEPTASNYSSILWTTSGTGTFSDPGTINPIYTPSAADVLLGSVNLVITGIPNTPCVDSISDTLILTLVSEPVSYAGVNDTICDIDDFSVTTASASNYSSLNWTTTGDGTFNNNTILLPVYTPGPSDISNGNVEVRKITPLSKNTNTPKQKHLAPLSKNTKYNNTKYNNNTTDEIILGEII